MSELPDSVTLDFENGFYYPVRTPNPKLKTYEGYFLPNARHMFSTHFLGGSFLPITRISKFAYLRAFAKGMQDSDFYKNYLTSSQYGEEVTVDKNLGALVGTKKVEHGFMSVLWDIMSTAPKIMRSLVGTMTKYKTDISADPIDAMGTKSIEDSKVQLWANKENLPFAKQYFGELGMSVPDAYQPDPMPESRDELDLYEAFGKFKPWFAYVTEKALKHTYDISVWPEIEQMLDRDFISIGVAGVYYDYDPEDGKVHPYYCDPATSGIQWSKYPDCRDSEHFYNFSDVSITVLKQYMPEQPPEFWKDLAFKYIGYAGNPIGNEWRNYQGQDSNGAWKFDFFKVCVMFCTWIDNDGNAVEYKSNKYGKVHSSVTEWDKKYKLTDDKKVEFSMDRARYEMKWIVGTKYIYQWGKSYNQIHPTKRDVSLPVAWYISQDTPIIEQLIPVFHNFQQLWLKYLNCINQSVTAGYNFNIDYIMNLDTGGEKDKNVDAQNQANLAIRRFMETGINLYSRFNAAGMQNVNDRPIDQLPGGMGQQLQDLMLSIRFNLSITESITGINPIVMGETPNPNAPVGTTEMSVNASASVLKPLIDGIVSIKKSCSNGMARYIQVLLRNNSYSRKAYEAALGEFDCQVLAAAAKDCAEMAINLTPRPMENEVQSFLQQMQQAVQAGQMEGFDAMILTDRLNSGVSMKQVILEYEYRRRKFMKAQADIATQKAKQEHDNRMDEITAGTKAQQAARAEDHGYKMDELKQEGENAIKKTVVGESVKHDKDTAVAKIRKDAQTEVASTAAEQKREQAQLEAEYKKQEIDATMNQPKPTKK